MKNYLGFKVGDKVIITNSHSGDEGTVGTIVEVKHSYCIIDEGRFKQNGKPWYYNHTYGQFKKVNNEDI